MARLEALLPVGEVAAVPVAVRKGTRVLISLWDSPMFGRAPGTRPNISESHSEISTRVPFCIGRYDGKVVAKLPFVPFNAVTSLTHRNLAGEDKTDCAMVRSASLLPV